MATHTDAPPPYTPGSPEFIEITATTIEQMESANRATRLQRYLLEIIAYSLLVNLEIIIYSLLVNLEIIIYSLLVNLKIIAYPLLVDLKSIAYYLAVDIPKLVKAISFEWPTYNSFHYTHRQIATSTLEDNRMLLIEAVEPSRTLNIDPGFTFHLIAAYADQHTKNLEAETQAQSPSLTS
ncbi:unnamed protein product [Alternaria sp. RS040]